MDELDRILNKATDPSKGFLHGAIFTVVDNMGNEIYKHAPGKQTIHSGDENHLEQDSLCWIASMTKVVTAVAVMQLVERGIVSLEDNIREIVPELRDVQILENTKEGKFLQEPARAYLRPVHGRITLRHLLCHTAGFIYDSSSPELKEWSKSQNRSAHTFCGSLDGYNTPLLFEPGSSWGYGGGVDWAGRMVEILTKSTLENYMQENIWSRLGATSTTFHPESYTELPPFLGMGLRTSPDSKTVQKGPIILKQPATNCLGGIGLFSTPSDFTKLLSALLQGGSPLLSATSVETLFQPQLGDESRSSMPKGLGYQMRQILRIKGVDDTDQADHCLAGTITLKDIPGRRPKGTINWSGLPNLHWWIDRQTGIAASLFTQLMPPGDPAVTSLTIQLEKALYKVLDKRKAQSGAAPKL